MCCDAGLKLAVLPGPGLAVAAKASVQAAASSRGMKRASPLPSTSRAEGVRRGRWEMGLGASGGATGPLSPGVWAACLLIPPRVVPEVDVAATARLTGFFLVLLVLFLAG